MSTWIVNHQHHLYHHYDHRHCGDSFYEVLKTNSEQSHNRRPLATLASHIKITVKKKKAMYSHRAGDNQR